MGPGVLSEILSQLPKFQDERLLIGFNSSDDAAVYKINDELAMIQTVDFFPPVVDDPFLFGQIAAANALSDVYAMGGTPTLAMNLMCFPSCLDLQIVKEIMEGGYSKVKEAGAIIAGGHTIEDVEPKYGLCVTGFAHPSDILANNTACEGDLLVMTKPLGTGILTTAAMAEILPLAEQALMAKYMTMLNDKAQRAMMPFHPTACTDVTGFGFLGHLLEMVQETELTARVFCGEVPIIDASLALARDGIIPAGAYRNMEFIKGEIEIDKSISQEMGDVLHDPQTSGGLLIALPEKQAMELAKIMEQTTGCGKIVGQMEKYDGKRVRVK